MYHTEEEAKAVTVTKKQAAHEISEHGIDPRKFFDEAGHRPEYTVAEVLNWLGY